MSEQRSSNPIPERDWPPLIVAETAPAWVRRRDFFLTLLMWILFAIMLETEFELFFGRFLEQLGLGDFDTDGKWDVFFERLRPYVRLALMLASTLAVASILTLIRRRRTLRQPPPPPLSVAEHAANVGMDAEALQAARNLRNCVVHIDDATGRHSIEPR